MKHLIITTYLFLALVAGCNEAITKNEDRQLINTELVNTYNNVAIENAIISQHTLYPYYFVNNGIELNELGDKDLGVLAKHFMEHPGKLNIKRGDVTDELYDARVKYVLEKLKQIGVDEKKISIADDMPGGTGQSSEKVLIIMEKENSSSSRISSTYKR